MGLKKYTQLDKDYMMTVIATLDATHEWFDKGYCRSRPVKATEYVDNADGFYDGLPYAQKFKPRGRARNSTKVKPPSPDQDTINRRARK